MEKKEQGQYPTLLTEQVSTLKDRLYGQEAEEENLPLRNKSRNPRKQETGFAVILAFSWTQPFKPFNKHAY